MDQSPGRRAAAYWFSDGLPDIVLGMMVLVVSLWALIWQILAPHRGIFDFFLTTTAFLLFYWKERAVLDWLKSRSTYPRTGYVRPPDEAVPTAGLTVLSLSPAPVEENVTRFTRRTVMVVFWVFYMLYTSRQPPFWLVPAVLAGTGAVLYIGNRNSEHPYPAWWALILALSGLIFLPGMLTPGVPPHLQPQLCGVITGGWLTTHGLSTLVRYRRANR